MHDYPTALESLSQTQTLFDQAAQARAYIAITEAQGPSQQLIDFINYDGGMKAEMGLESFDSFSTSTQHELLLSNLKPDALEIAGLEALSGAVNKIAGWLMGAGAAGFIGTAIKQAKNPTPTGLMFAGIAYGTLMAASLVKSGNAILNGIFPHTKFKKFEDNLPKAIAMDKALAEHLPTTFTTEAWDAYTKYWDETWDVTTPGVIHKWNWLYGVSTQGRVTEDVAGWTPESYKASVKTVVDAVKTMHAEELKFAGKLKTISDWLDHTAASGSDADRKLAKRITAHMGHTARAFHETRDLVDWLGRELNRIGKQYKVADKD